MADQLQDIKVDENYDLVFENGDFALEDADYVDIKLILLSDKGWWKQTPYMGANIPAQIKGFVDNKWIQKARLNLESDGFKVRTLKYVDNELQVEAKR